MEAVQSSDPTGSTTRSTGSRRWSDRRFRLFDTGFEELASVYAQSDDGHVRRSAVRAIDRLTPGLAGAISLVDEGDADGAAAGDVEERLDVAAGFQIRAIQETTAACDSPPNVR